MSKSLQLILFFGATVIGLFCIGFVVNLCFEYPEQMEDAFWLVLAYASLRNMILAYAYGNWTWNNSRIPAPVEIGLWLLAAFWFLTEVFI